MLLVGERETFSLRSAANGMARYAGSIPAASILAFSAGSVARTWANAERGKQTVRG